MSITRPPGPWDQLLSQLGVTWDSIDTALLAAGSSGGSIDVSQFATGGDGSAGAPWTGWDTAITFEDHGFYIYPTKPGSREGHYAYATSPNFLKTNITHIGIGGCFFHHTGSGDAFILDSDDPGLLWIHRARIENISIVGHVTTLSGAGSATSGTNTIVGTGTSFLSQIAVGEAIAFESGSANNETRLVTAIADDTHLTVSGNWLTSKVAAGMKCGKTRHGIRMSGVRNSLLRNLTIKEIAHAAIYTEWCVTNVAENFVLSYHDPEQFAEFDVRAQWGIKLDTNTTTWTFINPVIEGVQDAGIYTLNGSYGNTFVNGTSEGNKGKGAKIASVSNVFINTDFEANEGLDVEVLQSRNCFINTVIEQSITIAAGQGNRIQGGVIGSLVNDGQYTVLDGVEVLGTITGVDLATLINLPYVNTPDGNLRPDVRIGNVLDWVKDLTAGATVSTNARLGRIQYFTSDQNFTLANPTNGVNGQEVTWRMKQGGSHSITYGSKFRVPSSKEFPSMPIATGEILYLSARYQSTDDKWDIVQANSEIFSLFVAQDITTQDINATGGYSIDDVQVLTNQQPAITDPTGGSVIDVQARAQLVELLEATRAHGLIAVTPPFDLDFAHAWYPVHKLTFDADATVNKVRDLSGNRRHLLQGTLAKRPIFKTNQVDGKPVIRFDGVDDEMRSSAFAYNQPVCVSLVLKRFNNHFKYLFSSLANFGVAAFQGDGAAADNVSLFAGSTADPTGAIDSGTFYLLTCEFDTSSSNIYENTVLAGDSPGNPGSQNGDGLVLGNRYDSSLPSQIDVAELVIYDPSIRTDVETYLMTEYSL